MAVTRSRSDRVYNVFGLGSYANVGIGQRSGIRWEAPPTVHVDVRAVLSPTCSCGWLSGGFGREKKKKK